MLLHLLDTPSSSPQTMAFLVDRDEMAAYRVALRSIVQAGDVSPMRELWSAYIGRFNNAYNRARIQVDGAVLREFCTIAEGAASEEQRALLQHARSKIAKYGGHIDLFVDGLDIDHLRAGFDQRFAVARARAIDQRLSRLSEHFC